MGIVRCTCAYRVTTRAERDEGSGLLILHVEDPLCPATSVHLANDPNKIVKRMRAVITKPEKNTRAVIEWDEVFTSEKQVEDVIWSMNEGTWCADNLLDLLGHVCDDIDGECLCQFTVVSIVSITDPD
jgi:hypothetical protein